MTVQELLRRTGIDVGRWPRPPEAGIIDWRLREVIRSRGINCVIDVGGNRGTFAQRVRKLGYDGRIVSFEPSPTVLPVIRAAALQDANWTVRPVALAAESGTGQLRLHQESQLDSLLDTLPGVTDQVPMMASAGTVAIAVSTLEEEFPHIIEGIAEPRVLLKSDTQGYDDQVLRGAGAGGISPAVVAVLVELSAQPIYQEQPRMTSVMELVMAAGFTPVAFEPFFHSSDGLRIVELDALFMRAEPDSGPDWGNPRRASRATSDPRMRTVGQSSSLGRSSGAQQEPSVGS
jgi:FkbM family methyltransferase